jgi:DNA-directed RNA polymerase specialized sigma24 family protein
MDVRKQWLRLSPEHRAALLLIDMMGYPLAEAARIVGVSEGLEVSCLPRQSRAG